MPMRPLPRVDEGEILLRPLRFHTARTQSCPYDISLVGSPGAVLLGCQRQLDAQFALRQIGWRGNVLARRG